MGDPKAGPSPPTWKLLAVKWLGLYPMLVVVSYGLKWALPDTPLWVRLIIDTLILVPLLAYVITPQMDNWFSGWLYRGVDRARDSIDVGS